MKPTTAQTFSQLVAEVKNRVHEVESRLDAKIQQRDEILAALCPKKEVLEAFTQAVDTAAARFEPRLNAALVGATRRPRADRHRVFDRLPWMDDMMTTEALCYFCRDLILSAARLRLETLHWPGGSGVGDAEREERLAVLEREIEVTKEERDVLLDEMRGIALPSL